MENGFGLAYLNNEIGGRDSDSFLAVLLEYSEREILCADF